MGFSFSVREKDRGFKRLRAAIEELKDTEVKVGVLSDEKHPGSDLTNVELAAILTFGTADGHVPARPFIEPPLRKNRSEYRDLLKKLLRKSLEGKITAKDAFDLIGEKMVVDIRKYITDGVPPPNAPSTIARKGSSTPLIDTGALFNAITYATIVGHSVPLSFGGR